MSIEQAVFTSAKNAQSAGYALIGRSAGVTDADARELTAWGPSHDSLAPTCAGASINCFSLASGNLCVSRTVAAGEEYSGRGGSRIYTQFLLVPPDAAARFSFNPFAIMRAAGAKGVIRVATEVPAVLPRFELTGRARPFDENLLFDLHAAVGSSKLGALIDPAIFGANIGLVGADEPDQLLAGVINCLPVSVRSEWSFSTGLKHSLRRPFRWIVLSSDKTEQRQLQRQHGLTILDLAQPTKLAASSEWSRAVIEVAESRNTASFAAAIEAASPVFPLAAGT